MNALTQIIEQILLGLSITIIGVEGVLSLLNRLGFLPNFIAKVYTKRDKQLVAMTLEESGIKEKTPIIRQAMDYWRTEALATSLDTKHELTELICNITRETRAEVGLYKKVRLKYYIDLADYTTDWEKLETLAQLMCSNIKLTLSILNTHIQIDKIAASPGNPALAVVTARKLYKPFISVTPISPLSSDPVSGKIENGNYIILVHDVVLTGYRLADIANALRNAGAQVEHAFVLVERTDNKISGGDSPSETLSKNGIKLHSIISLNDQDIKELLKRLGKRNIK